jgi:hypothetical protein
MMYNEKILILFSSKYGTLVFGIMETKQDSTSFWTDKSTVDFYFQSYWQQLGWNKSLSNINCVYQTTHHQAGLCLNI